MVFVGEKMLPVVSKVMFLKEMCASIATCPLLPEGHLEFGFIVFICPEKVEQG